MHHHIVKGFSLSLSRHTSGVFVFPPAWFVSALAPGQTHRRRAEEHRQRHFLHQQPAEVGGRPVVTFNLTSPRFTNQTITSLFLWFSEAMVDTTYVWVITCDCFVFSYILFSILPTICDIIIAIIYFVSYFNVWFGLIVFTCMVLYLSESNLISNWDQFSSLIKVFNGISSIVIWGRQKINSCISFCPVTSGYPKTLTLQYCVMWRRQVHANVCIHYCSLACWFGLQFANGTPPYVTQSNLTDIFLDSLCLKFVWRQVLKSTQTETKTRPVQVWWCMTDSC